MRHFACFALVLFLSLTTVSGETHAASCWSTPALVTAMGDASPGSLTIDPSGNWEVLYDSWDDQNNKVIIKYFNSVTGSQDTGVEYTECWDGPTCPPGTIADFEGITSARDSTGKLHVVYGIERAVDYADETYYMYKDADGWSAPELVTAVGDATPGSLTIDPIGNWELVYDAWDDENDIVRIKYFNSGSPSPVTVLEYHVCWTEPCPPGSVGDIDDITSARDYSTGKLHVVFYTDSAIYFSDETYYMYKDEIHWSDPVSLTAAVGGTGSLTIDPSGNWELVYDAWDDENDIVRIKYFNSGSSGSGTIVEFQECWEGASCPPGSIEDFNDITSARDATGKLHIAYGIDSAVDYSEKTFYMHTDDSIVGADFTANVTSGSVPLAVNFTDQSCGTITSWQWSFGDGATSNEQNPSHTYSKPGTFTVSLTVTGPSGSDGETKTDFISVRGGMPGIPLLLLDD